MSRRVETSSTWCWTSYRAFSSTASATVWMETSATSFGMCTGRGASGELLWQWEGHVVCLGASFYFFCWAISQLLVSIGIPSLDFPMLAHWSWHEALLRAYHFAGDFCSDSLQLWGHWHLTWYLLVSVQAKASLWQMQWTLIKTGFSSLSFVVTPFFFPVITEAPHLSQDLLDLNRTAATHPW